MIRSHLWFIVGTIKLLYLTVQDYKNNMMVDDRLNYFMMGSTFALLSIYNVPFLYLLGLTLSTSVLGLVLGYMVKKELLGSADLKSMLWIYFGFGFFGNKFLITFIIAFIVLLILFFVLTKYVVKAKNRHVPFYTVIFLSFVVNNLYWGFYF
jgi:hypothetical protein